MNRSRLRHALLGLGVLTLSSCDGPSEEEAVEADGVPLAAAADQCGVKMIPGEREAALARPRGPRALAATPEQVWVYFHNVKKSAGTDRVKDGHIADSVFNTMLNKLNANFHGITFLKKGIDRVVKPEWFEIIGLSDQPPTQAEINMKTTLRKGNHAMALNIYTRGGGTIVSSATFPWNYGSAPWRDGVAVHVDSWPRSGVDGDSPIHEVGHWLGLPHTFEGGCNGFLSPDDVGHEASPNRTACTSAPNTCSNDNGLLDPIFNYMDYTPPSCQNVRSYFTDGQGSVMWENMYAFRVNF